MRLVVLSDRLDLILSPCSAFSRINRSWRPSLVVILSMLRALERFGMHDEHYLWMLAVFLVLRRLTHLIPYVPGFVI